MASRWIAAGALGLGLGGCALASSSGVFAIGNDTWRVTTVAGSALGGAATARRFAYGAATKTCAKAGGRLVVLDDDSSSRITGASVDLTFKCEAPAK